MADLVVCGSSTLREVRLVVTASYLPGALVTLYSFVAHNAWFDGDIVVYCLAGEETILSQSLVGLPNLHFRSVSLELHKSIAEALPPGGNWVIPRLYALDVLRTACQGAVLVLDADLLFTASIQELETMHADVIASAEGAFYRGVQVDRATNAFVPAINTPDLIKRTFNSGLMWLSPEMLGPQVFEAALDVLRSPEFLTQSRPQHDQYILNRLFENRWHDVGPQYNYLLKHADAIYGATGLRLAEAKVIHFNVEPRPWEIRDVCEIKDGKQARACAWWLRAFADVMEQLPLRRVMQSQ